MAATFGQVVEYVTKVTPTFKDPTGNGERGAPDVPANYGRIAAIVQRVMSGNRAVLFVATVPPFGIGPVPEFNPALPKWGTWRALT